MADPVGVEDIIAYYLGDLTPERAAEVEHALSESAEAKAKLASVDRMITDLREDDAIEAPAALVRRATRLMHEARKGPGLLKGLDDLVERVIAHLVFDSRVGPAVAGLRGQSATRHLAWECGPLGDLHLQVADVGADRFRIMGQIESEEDKVFAGVATLHSEDEGATPLESALDDDGVFAMDVGRGQFALVLDLGDRMIEAPPFEIG